MEHLLLSTETNPWIPCHVRIPGRDDATSLPRAEVGGKEYERALVYHHRTRRYFRSLLRDEDSRDYRTGRTTLTLFMDQPICLVRPSKHTPRSSRFYCPKRSAYHKAFYGPWTIERWEKLPEYPYIYQDHLLGKLVAVCNSRRPSSAEAAYASTPEWNAAKLAPLLWAERDRLSSHYDSSALLGIINGLITDRKRSPWPELLPLLIKWTRELRSLNGLPALLELDAEHHIVQPDRIAHAICSSFLKPREFAERFAYYKKYHGQQVRVGDITTTLATLTLLEHITKSTWGSSKETARKRFSLVLDACLDAGASPQDALGILCLTSEYSWRLPAVAYLVALGARPDSRFFDLINMEHTTAHETVDDYQKLEALLTGIEADKPAE